MVQELFHGQWEVLVVQRPVFQLDIEEFWLWELAFLTVIIPGEKAVATLRFFPSTSRVSHAACSLERAGRSRELPPKVRAQLELSPNKPLPKSCF